MAEWLTVYCSRSVEHVTAADLLARLRDIEDVCTLAEGFGIDDDDAVTRAMKALRIVPVNEPAGAKWSLRYRSARLRPVLIHHWSATSRVRVERAEALEQLETVTGRNVTRVRAHLEKCVEIFALELGGSQLTDMAIVLAGQIAEFLAIEGTGLIRDQADDWWAMKKSTPVLLVGPSDKP